MLVDPRRQDRKIDVECNRMSRVIGKFLIWPCGVITVKQDARFHSIELLTYPGSGSSSAVFLAQKFKTERLGGIVLIWKGEAVKDHKVI